ncbi:glycerol acyltransferase [Oleiphilus sp. HI0009]|nr:MULTISPECIES: lysophospholipid acyltransferase family protein [unclassified Oleiphilus]KZX76045.1 glycerol acyltransferase [Oleiphilus sp. HI0009]KZY64994.1 glycerol acyltransferase [Oleiphilus sp. HI0066]KZY67806.1 glycerol acyltransferase [Oleiphilus sp. HI0067]
MNLKSFLKKQLVSQELDEKLDRIEKPVGSLGYDPWGFNTDMNKIVFSLFSNIYDKYFRVETSGLEHIPNDGPVLIIANHSGQLPIDGTLIGYAVANRDHAPRYPRAMIERFFPTVPYIGNMLNQLGAVLGDPTNCAKMLENGEAVIVFPEGIRGSGKMYKDRYQLQRFGNGFVRLAMEHNTPIVPVGVVGCEETIPAIANIKPLAKLLGVPYVPVALPFIFPAKVHLNFGKPIYFENEELTEDQVIRRVEKVKKSIGQLIAKGLEQRKSIF